MAINPSSLKIENLDIVFKNFPVVNSVINFDKNGELNPLGLFSKEIFGDFLSSERSKQFAKIEFGTKVLHPYVYDTLKNLYRSIDSILAGHVPYVIKNGKVELAKPEDTKLISGYNLVMNNFTKFLEYVRKDKGEEITQGADKNITTLESIPLSATNTSIFPVIPANFRDINILNFERNGVVRYEPINDFYIELIQLSNASDDSDSSRLLIQQSLAKLHDFIMKEQLSGKGGKIKKNLGKKPVAYAARGVISARPVGEGNTWNDPTKLDVPMGYVGLPVANLVSMFFPFFQYELKKFLSENKDIGDEISKLASKLTGTNVGNNDGLAKIILDAVSKDYKFGFNKAFSLKSGTIITIMDLLKKISYIVCGEKGKEPRRFAIGTRYPITNAFSDQFLAIVPIVCKKFVIEDGWEIGVDIEANYSNSILLNDASHNGYGSDFDGDQLAFIGIFNNDANAKILKQLSLIHI